MIIRGDRLTPDQRRQVLDAYIYRWTVDNPHRARAYAGLDAPTIPPATDDAWLLEHAFHFTKAGRLHTGCRAALPACLAD